jgi:hypothetical protein
MEFVDINLENWPHRSRYGKLYADIYWVFFFSVVHHNGPLCAQSAVAAI